MADKWPLANGNWSNAANWNGGTKPVAGDDVFADGRTVTIDENVNVASVRTTARSGGTAGGGFVLPPDITVTATVIGHINAHCLTRSAAGNPSYVIGNVQGSTTNGGFGSGVLNSSSGTVFITGDVFGGSGGADGTLNSNAGIINSSSGGFVVTGNVTAGGNGASGANIFGSGTFVLTGSVRSNNYSAAVTVGGSVASTLNISINPASTHPAVTVGGTGIATVNGTIQTFTDLVAVNVVSATATLRMNGNLIDGPNGCSPVAGARIWYGPGAHQRRSNTGGSFAGPLITFTSYANAGAPAVSNVRKDVVYGPANEFTGTCAVPPANSTAFGVPVDNTVGTAVITEAGLTTLLQQALSPNAAVAVERSIDDEKAITFSWPVSGATITGEKSVDNGTYSAVAGAIAFLRSESGRHYYTLAYDADDRTDEEATIRYKMTDGTYTKYFNLRLVPPGITPEQIQTQLEDDFQGVLDAVGNIEVDNAAIAEAVETQLADDFAAITEDIDNETIAQLVYQSIVGSGVVRYSIPQVTGTIEAVKYADFETSIPASTASDSILYLSIGCENHTTPNLQADSEDGLTILNQRDDFNPADVTVIRTSPTAVTVWISARVLSKLSAAEYILSLTEITSDAKTKLRFEKFFSLRSGAGRVIG